LSREHVGVELEAELCAEVAKALRKGHDILVRGGCSLDAVCAAVSHLEDAPRFNAGRGSVLTRDATVEMEASIMEGAGRRAGAVTGLSQVKNPVLLARAVLEQGEQVMLAGASAEDFARAHGLPLEHTSYFITELRRKQLAKLQAKDGGHISLSEDAADGQTVGAVALDSSGTLAAATSTGGLMNKRSGRIGDSPLIGAGTYADNRSAAVSTTGHGEIFIRAAVAHDVCARVRFAGATLQEAAAQVVHGELRELAGNGGLIAVDPSGNVVMTYNSDSMIRGAIDVTGALTTAIFTKRG
jgi:L-asparaginase / beta-aspartyl-peptidase